MRCGLIFLAGGRGTRFTTSAPKQYTLLGGKPLFEHSLASLLFCDEIAIVCAPEYRQRFPKAANICFAHPGDTRQHSLENGFKQLSPRCDFVLTHDAARPFIASEDLTALLDSAKRYGAAALAKRATHTMKQSDAAGNVLHTLPKANLWESYTPQCIRYDLLKEGIAHAQKHALSLTDDIALIEQLGHTVRLVPCCIPNLKLTTPDDYALAQALMHL